MSGSGGSGGYEYQDNAIGYVATHILAGEALGWLETGAPDIPVAVAAETKGPGDDLCITLQNDIVVELQAKHGLTKDKLFEPLLKLAKGLHENPNMYSVLLTDTTASQTIRNDLRKNLEIMGQSRFDGLKPITRDFQDQLAAVNLPHQDSDIFQRLRVVVLDLDDDAQGAKHAQLLLSTLIADNHQASTVWRFLCDEGRKLSSNPGKRDFQAWQRLLKSNSIALLDKSASRELGKRIHCIKGLRETRLESQLKKSKARCVARWQSVGISEQQAITLADDSSIGTPPFSLETILGRLVLLVGDIGTGKSLIGDRLFQAAISKAKEDIDAPIPIYFRAGQLQNRQSLEKAVEKDVLDLGYPSSTNTLVIIDEVDDLGFNDASNLLQEARELVQLSQQITIVIISKPIPGFADTPESIQTRLLDRETSINLIKQLSGKQHFSPDDLSRPLQEAILTPLFAVLLATYLRENYVSLPESKFQLISNLVELFLHRLRDKVIQVNALLAKLAVACIDNGGAAVSANEVDSWFEQQQLLDSKLIIKESDNLQFPLPILTYWFAAQSLLADRSLVRNIVLDYSRLERWRYPLVIATATFSPTQVAEILAPLAERQPAIAADVVTEALAFQGRSIHIPNQTALQIGQQVRCAIQAWIKGFDSFAHLLPFIQKDGTLPSVGVRFNQKEFAKVEVAWHSGNSDLDDVVTLPPHPTDYKQLFEQGWKDISEFLAYSHTSWVWKWTLERVVSSLIKSRSLPVSPGYLSREAAWFAALSLTNRHSGSVSPIDLDNLEALLSRIDASRYPPKLQHCLRQLVIEIDFARRNGETHLGLFPAIQQFKVSPSYETLIKYAESVYFGAFQGYMQLIDLLAPYLPHLPIASILPARLTIAVVPPRGTSRTVTWSWYWEPLPSDSQNEVALRVSDHTISNHDPEVQRALEKIRSLHPQWIEHFSVRPQQVSPCTELWLGHYPVTALAYKWLWNDLKRVSWLTENLDDPDITYWSTVSQHYSSGMNYVQ